MAFSEDFIMKEKFMVYVYSMSVIYIRFFSCAVCDIYIHVHHTLMRLKIDMMCLASRVSMLYDTEVITQL